MTAKQEHGVQSVQHRFRQLRDQADSGLDLVCETRVQVVLQDPVNRASIRAHVAALEGKLDQIEETIKIARKELAAIEGSARLEEVDRIRENGQ